MAADPSWVSAVCFCGPVERRVLRRKRLLVLWSGHFNLPAEQPQYFNKTEPVFRHYTNSLAEETIFPQSGAAMYTYIIASKIKAAVSGQLILFLNL